MPASFSVKIASGQETDKVPYFAGNEAAQFIRRVTTKTKSKFQLLLHDTQKVSVNLLQSH